MGKLEYKIKDDKKVFFKAVIKVGQPITREKEKKRETRGRQEERRRDYTRRGRLGDRTQQERKHKKSD